MIMALRKKIKFWSKFCSKTGYSAERFVHRFPDRDWRMSSLSFCRISIKLAQSAKNAEMLKAQPARTSKHTPVVKEMALSQEDARIL